VLLGSQLSLQFRGRKFSDIRVPDANARMVRLVSLDSEIIDLDRGRDAKAGLLESERQASAPGEEKLLAKARRVVAGERR
jgi:hypothetical protein